ncbi:TPM domain-containing protein [Pantanalinema rosaneae CENA516]|uniref:TPM domain-containing protein n=1 Tax=Pantanalinema rosaneae TaxID=1620701 RepID=UPI003D6DC910
MTLVLVSFASHCLAVPIASVPNPRRTNGGWVTDMAELLTPATKKQLNRQISELEAKNSSEIAVVTVPYVSSATNPKAFATQLFNTWGIGKKGRNNGVLLLVSKGDRRVEIITGKGLRTLLPDSQVSRILQQEVTPRFKQSQFDAGVLAGTRALVTQVSRYRPPQVATVPAGSPPAPSQNPPSIAPKPLATTATPLPLAAPVAPAHPAAIVAPQDSDNWFNPLWGGLGIGTASIGVIMLSRRLSRVFLAPEGDSRTGKAGVGAKRFHCAVCRQQMEQLTAGELSLFLSEPQQTAQELGSVVYHGWRCKPCQASLYGRGFHLRASVMDDEQFSLCPTCEELTAVHSSELLKQPTWNQEGKNRVKYQCRCCSKQWQTEEAIPCLPLPKNAVTIPPSGRSRVNNFHLFQQAESERPTHCASCHHPMQQVGSEQIHHLLREPERVAGYLGSVAFLGWHCSHCAAGTTDIHIRAYVQSSRYQHCPNCQELTIEETSRTSQAATSYSEGQRQIIRKCHCCSFVHERWETIPRLATPVNSSSTSTSHWQTNHSLNVSSSSSSWNSHHYSSDSSGESTSSWSYSDQSTSSSGSDFGGGSTDGGGAGSSWSSDDHSSSSGGGSGESW